MESELLQQILTELQALKSGQSATNERLDKVDARLDKMENDLGILKEDSKVTRASVNTLLDWAEDAQIEVKIPLYKKAR